MIRPFAQVVFPLPIYQIFTYSLPKGLEDVKVGVRVLAPFRNQKLTGFLVGWEEEAEVPQVKEILEVLDSSPLLNEEMLKLTKWVSEYYLCSWGEAIKAALPAGMEFSRGYWIRLKEPYSLSLIRKLEKKNPLEAKIVELLSLGKEMKISQLLRRVRGLDMSFALASLEKQGYVEMVEFLKVPKAKGKKRKVILLQGEPEKVKEVAEKFKSSSPKQAQVLFKLLGGKGRLAQSEMGVDWNVLQALKKKGLIEISEEEVLRDQFGQSIWEEPKCKELTLEQRRILENVIQAGKRESFEVFLLHGVTGSGKTEVYIQAIRNFLEMGRQALVLVPEISLTPQILARFRAHFSEGISVLHSRLSLGERYDAWRQIKEGKVKIVIGARSAVFAPLNTLGLIVVDEEHENSYKQSDLNPRYNARDVAVMRAKLSKGVVILGSATPSLESYFNTQSGKYRLEILPQRIDNRPLPPVRIVDMRKEERGKVFSEPLKKAIAERIERREKIILFLNRRGFSNFVQCRDCGLTIRCPRCSVTLTHHFGPPSTMQCHYCGYKKRAPERCPNCRSHNFYFQGIGTEKVEEELKREFPQAKFQRMDVDTTRRKGSHFSILFDFKEGETNILIGTQMIAKGLDFPAVTLVGVILADTALNLPDFRTGEKTFQLLTQVAGRTGRGESGGEVIIQTYCPEHYAIRASEKHDYTGFYLKELQERQELFFPPVSRLISILIRTRKRIDGIEASNQLKTYLEKEKKAKELSSLQILGPAPAPLFRLRGEHRWQIILKLREDSKIKKILWDSLLQVKEISSLRAAKVSIDVDPIDVL